MMAIEGKASDNWGLDMVTIHTWMTIDREGMIRKWSINYLFISFWIQWTRIRGPFWMPSPSVSKGSSNCHLKIFQLIVMNVECFLEFWTQNGCCRGNINTQIQLAKILIVCWNEKILKPYIKWYEYSIKFSCTNKSKKREKIKI